MSLDTGSTTMSRQSKIAFVGNISYDVTEEQLVEIFQEVGPVVAFRLVFCGSRLIF